MKRIQILPECYLLLVLLLLVLPVQWMIPAILSAVFHESCHMLAIRCMGGEVIQIRIGSGGIQMEMHGMNALRELVCAFAGPAGSMLLVLTRKLYPQLAACALIHGLFNLIPVYPLDGGRILRCILKIICTKRAEQIAKTLEAGLILMLSAGMFWIGYRSKQAEFVIMTAFLLYKVAAIKIPCKRGQNGVQ